MAGQKVLLLLLVLVCVQERPVESKDDDAWWTNTIVYQVYPRSFQDSNDDGTGDIKGIEQRLEHFVELGAETIWLSPIYQSPMADFGYDISNFTDVDPIFGSLKDFQQLSLAAHERGLKIVMDFVPNHSSNEHEWFKKSVARVEPYTDYYVWKDPIGVDDQGDPIPPNNWLSVFRFSAWEYVEERGQFYYHAFTVQQPDLNYRNPLVVEEMKNVLRYWVGEQGVDGFRMDAVPFLFEDPEFRDEPISNKTDDENDYGYLDHIYTFNLPQVYDMIHQFTTVLSAFEIADGVDRVVMVEALSADLSVQDLMQYYDVCDFAFNFNLIVHLPSPVTAVNIEQQVRDWLVNMPNGKTANWVLGNHDNGRVGSRFTPELVDGMNMIALLLPGVAVTYNGDEIGMLNTNISYEDTVDPAGCNCGPDRYQECSRDPERTPMQWSSDKNAGFSNAEKTWLPVNPNYMEVNVANQKAAEESHLKVYKALSSLRATDSRVNSGQVDMISTGPVFAFNRHNEEPGVIIAAVNTEEDHVIVDISHLATGSGTVLLRSINSDNSATVPGSQVTLNSLILGPYEGVVIDTRQA